MCAECCLNTQARLPSPEMETKEPWMSALRRELGEPLEQGSQLWPPRITWTLYQMTRSRPHLEQEVSEFPE